MNMTMTQQNRTPPKTVKSILVWNAKIVSPTVITVVMIAANATALGLQLHNEIELFSRIVRLATSFQAV